MSPICGSWVLIFGLRIAFPCSLSVCIHFSVYLIYCQAWNDGFYRKNVVFLQHFEVIWRAE
jgi:hypothetical protein